jgi:hypothetical protein
MNLINRIDNYLVKSRKEYKRERHYPSDISACVRQLFYKWKNEKPTNPIDATGYWKMGMGNKIHDLVNEFLDSEGMEIINEIANRKKLDFLKHEISYRIDNLFIDEDGELSIIEIKTTYGNGVKWIKDSGMPKESDLMQVMCYMYLEKIPRAYLLYVGRDNAYRCQFKIDIRGDRLCANGRGVHIKFRDIFNKLILLERHLEDNSIPDRCYRAVVKNGDIKDKIQYKKEIYKTDWQCSYCQWKDTCWEECMSDKDNIYYDGKVIE